jgi:ankyrin repeat protein
VEDIYLAAALGDIALVKTYLAKDASLLEAPGMKCDVLGDGEHAKVDEKGKTHVLIVAINSKQPAMVKFLLAQGADPNARGSYAFATPLHHAAFKGDVEMLSALLASEADLEAVEDTHHGTPLQWAVVSGKPAAVELLLGAGAKVRPDMMQMAKDGERGRLKDISNEKPEAFKKVQELLKSAGK